MISFETNVVITMIRNSKWNSVKLSLVQTRKKDHQRHIVKKKKNTNRLFLENCVFSYEVSGYINRDLKGHRLL